jgi:hypothetical protein
MVDTAVLILGGLALYALMRPQVSVSSAALARLGVITDMEYLTLEPASLLPDIEIIGVQIIEDPVPDTYAKVWVSIVQNAVGVKSIFVRIIDDDTGSVVGYKKNFITIGEGDSKVVKYDWLDDWSVKMPNRIWNLRIETGTN